MGSASREHKVKKGKGSFARNLKHKIKFDKQTQFDIIGGRMKRYNVTTREIWHVTREVEAEDSFNAGLNYLEGPEIKRVRICADHCEDFNITERTQNENTRN